MKIIKLLIVTMALFFSALTWAAPVNINTADAKTIAKVVKGVGEKRAQAIVDYREKNGPYASVDDLVKIKGIGKKTVDKNRENMTVGESTDQ